jgi:hypothetical protein
MFPVPGQRRKSVATKKHTRPCFWEKFHEDVRNVTSPTSAANEQIYPVYMLYSTLLFVYHKTNNKNARRKMEGYRAELLTYVHWQAKGWDIKGTLGSLEDQISEMEIKEKMYTHLPGYEDYTIDNTDLDLGEIDMVHSILKLYTTIEMKPDVVLSNTQKAYQRLFDIINMCDSNLIG